MDLVTILAEVEDPGRDYLKEHSLERIFYITMPAVVCGAESWYEVAEFGKMKKPFLRSRIKGFKGIPSHDTFNRVFSILDQKELECGFRLCSDHRRHDVAIGTFYNSYVSARVL